MKVGVYMPGFTSHAGGGYTFEQEILTYLTNNVLESHHHFTLFFDNVSAPDKFIRINSNKLKSIVLEQQMVAPKLPVFVEKIIRRLGYGKPPVMESPLQNSAKAEKIEFIWFPTPISTQVEIPYVATLWDIQHRLQPWFPEVSQAGQWTDRESYFSTYLRRASYVITGSEEGRNELSFFYQIPHERIRILPLPVPAIESTPLEVDVLKVLEKYGISSNYLLYPAQFWSHKNHANLLLALQILQNKYGEKIHLVLVGSDQGNLGYIRNLVDTLKLQDYVYFLGFIPRDDLIALYHKAHALVFVTLFGPDNLPPLEAFKCDCPVIVSKYKGAEEQLGDAPLFVNALDPNEIAEAIHRLGQEPDLRKTLIEKGRQRAAIYSISDYIRDVMKIFDEFENIRHNWGTE